MTEESASHDMSLEEKRTWAVAAIMVVALLVYLGSVTVRHLQPGPLIEISWVAPMAWTFGLSAAASFAAIGIIRLGTPKAGRRKDVRDADIERFGTTVSHGFIVIGALTAFILLLIEVDQFWAAHSLFYGFMISGIFSSFAKIRAYRKGIESL